MGHGPALGRFKSSKVGLTNQTGTMVVDPWSLVVWIWVLAVTPLILVEMAVKPPASVVEDGGVSDGGTIVDDVEFEKDTAVEIVTA